MVRLEGTTTLLFSHEAHANPHPLRVKFRRLLRVRDDGFLNKSSRHFGTFPLTVVDDHLGSVPELMARRGGVLLPAYPFEALSIAIFGHAHLPYAVKIAAGKVNVLTGTPWRDEIEAGVPDYIVVEGFQQIDGFYVDRGVARQFVITPTGQDLTAEEQLTGAAAFGGIQIAVYPLKAAIADRLMREHMRRIAEFGEWKEMRGFGLAPGGLLDQELFVDRLGFDAWDQEGRMRCFVHVVNAGDWSVLTGRHPLPSPITQNTFLEAGLPPDPTCHSNSVSRPAGGILARLKSIAQFEWLRGAPLDNLDEDTEIRGVRTEGPPNTKLH